MKQFLQRLLGGNVAEPARVRGPLGLHLQAGFTLDTLAFRLLEEDIMIELSGEEYTVAAISHIDLGGGSQIFRYYTSGDEFLQISTTGGLTLTTLKTSNCLFMKRVTASTRNLTGVPPSARRRWAHRQ